MESDGQGETEEDEPDQDQGDHLCDPIPEAFLFALGGNLFSSDLNNYDLPEI